jgi:hypothetical protein
MYTSKERLSMKKILTQSAVAGVGLAFASAAFAAKPDVRLAYKAMNLYGTSTTSKVAGEEQPTTSELGLKTFDPSVEIAIFVPGWAIYTYPGMGTASMWVGWAGISGFEVGPTFNFTSKSTEVKPKTGDTVKSSESSYTVGAYAYYALAAGSTNLELTLNPSFTMTSKETPAEGTNPKSESSGSSLGVLFDLTVPFTIAEKLDYAPGVDVTFSSGSDKVKDGDKTETSTLTWNLNVAKFRYTF